MWHDEINAFAIALHSPALPALFHNLHYEGHPALWYLLLWFASIFSTNPETAAVVHVVIVLAIYGLIGLASPFSTLEKLLLLSGYLLGFEYAVLARNYSLGILFALLYAESRAKHPDRIVLNSTLLGLLGNTTVFGLMMSGAFACEYAIDLLRRKHTIRRVAAGATVYAAFVAACLLTIAPAPDIGQHGNAWLFHYAGKLWHLNLAVVSTVSLPFLPFNADFPLRYWLGMEPGMRQLWHLREFGLIPIVAALIWIFRRDVALLAVVAATGAATALFCHLIYMTGIRQTGIFFVAVLTALWMQRIARPNPTWIVPLLLLGGSAAGIEAQIGQWQHPFSNAGAAAQFLIDNDLQNAGLIGMRDDWTIPVTELLHRPLYGLDCQCVESFMRFDASHDIDQDAPIVDRLARAVSQVHAEPLILIWSNPWRFRVDADLERVGLRLDLIADFRGAESGENYQIFQIERTN